MEKQPPSPLSPLRSRFGGVVFNGSPPRASRLHFAPLTEREETGIAFALDDRFQSEIRVDWSGVGGLPTESESVALNLALVSIVAQLALPGSISGPQLPPRPTQSLLRRLLRMLYDIRCFCDETPYQLPPSFVGHIARQRSPVFVAPENPERVLVLLSGGFDSAFALIVLRSAGFDVEALHVRTNRHVEDVEERAARQVAGRLGVPIHSVTLAASDLEAVGRYYSRSYGIYPFYNSVPHGRDFPLAVLATIIARRLGCGRVAFGHERESRRKVLSIEGHRIYRHDVESNHGAGLVRQYLRESLGSSVRLFSPIAGASVYLVRAIMLRQFPDLAHEIQFCFWGRRCEKCLKCLSTYTMQRHLDTYPIPFEQNPFADEADLDMALFSAPDRPSEALGYGPQMHYAMKQIVDSDRTKQDDFWLHHFKEVGIQQIEREWKRICSICLPLHRPPEVPSAVHEAVKLLKEGNRV